MKVEIVEDDFEMEISKWTPRTRELFEVYSKHFSESNKKHVSESNKEESSVNPRMPLRAPNNTALFLNWLESNNISEFKTDDFVSAYSQITKEAAEKIIIYQLQQDNLLQMGKDSFVVKKNGK